LEPVVVIPEAEADFAFLREVFPTFTPRNEVAAQGFREPVARIESPDRKR
jgi:hypothetical protein